MQFPHCVTLSLENLNLLCYCITQCLKTNKSLWLWKLLREINLQCNSSLNALISPNFCKKIVKVNFCNIHTVLHQPKCNFFFLSKRDFSCIYLPSACINKLLGINWDTSKSQNHANKTNIKFVKWNVKFSELVTHRVEKWEIHFHGKIFREINSF